nr:hypothetical protein Iba_chr09eCG2890 [Ipomoea batatas]
MLIAIPEKTTNPAVLAIAFSLSSPSAEESSAGPRLFHIDPTVRVESLSSSENTNPRSINPFTSSNSSSDKLRVFLLRLKPDETVSFLTFDLGNSRYSLPERTGWSLGDPERTDLGEWVSDSNLSLLLKHCSLNDLTINVGVLQNLAAAGSSTIVSWEFDDVKVRISCSNQKESKRLRIVSICSSFWASIFTGDEDEKQPATSEAPPLFADAVVLHSSRRHLRSNQRRRHLPSFRFVIATQSLRSSKAGDICVVQICNHQPKLEEQQSERNL